MKMPRLLFEKIVVVGIALRTVKMNPHQFPGIVLTADVGIFVPAVQKKAVPGLGVHSGKAAVSAIAGGGGAAPSAHIAAGGRNWLGGVAVCDLAAAGEHDQKQVGLQTAPLAHVRL